MTLKNLARCRLLLQGFGEFAVALLQFFEQSHVLDGDDRLVGEGLEKPDLLFREGTDFGATNINRPDGNTFTEERGHKEGSSARLLLKLPYSLGTRSRFLLASHRHEMVCPIQNGPPGWETATNCRLD